MRRSTIVFFSIIMLFSCGKQVKEQPLSVKKSDLLGEWSSEDEENYFFFNDTVCLPYDFYLYSNWKLDSNRLQIYNLESRPEKDSLWFNYLITDFYKDSLILTNTAYHSDSNKVTLYQRKENTQNNIDFIHLKRLKYPGEESVFKISVSKNGEVSFKEETIKNETFLSTCAFDTSEMNILNTMIERIQFSEIDSTYISGISDQDYYSLALATLMPKDTLRMIIDTGSKKVPNMIPRIITYIWATTKLKCTPSRYNNWRMYYNPIMPN